MALTQDNLCEIYLDFRNNFLTVQGYADYYNLPYPLAMNLIAYAREVYFLLYEKE